MVGQIRQSNRRSIRLLQKINHFLNEFVFGCRSRILNPMDIKRKIQQHTVTGFGKGGFFSEIGLLNQSKDLVYMRGKDFRI